MRSDRRSEILQEQSLSPPGSTEALLRDVRAAFMSLR
jgi:hypothetical protein